MDYNLGTDALRGSSNVSISGMAPLMQAYDTDRTEQRARMAAAQAAMLQARQPNPAAAAFTQGMYAAAQQPGILAVPDQAPVKASFLNSVGRGVDQLQQSLYGFAAQVGDMAGNKDLRNWGLLGSYANEDQIAANPRQVPSIGDIHSMGDFGNWFTETLGEQIPNLALNAGVAAATGGASLAAGLPAGAARALGQAGFFGAVMAPESGQAYLTDIAKHPGNTSPGMDLLTGAVNAGLESMFSVEAGIAKTALNKILGHEISAAADTVAKRTIGQFLLNRAKGGLKEGTTEGLQELTQILNERMQDNNFDDMFNEADVKRILESVAAGAALGAPFSMLEGHGKKGKPTLNADGTTNSADYFAGGPKNTADLLARFSGQAPDSQVLNLADATRNQKPTSWDFGTPDNSYLAQYGDMAPSGPTPFETTPDQFLQQTPAVNPYTNVREPSALVQEALRKQREAGFAPFETTPDQFLQQQPTVTPYQNAPFQQNVNDSFLDQATVTPRDFASTPDQFLQQTPEVRPNQVSPFQQSPDTGFLNQATAGPAGFERTSDQFLGQQASVIPNLRTPMTTAEIMSGQAASLGMSRDTALATVHKNFGNLISTQTEASNRTQDQLATLTASLLERKAALSQQSIGADPITQRRISKVIAGLDEHIADVRNQTVAAQAKLAAMQEQYKTAMDSVNKLYDARERKLSAQALTAQETTRQQLVTKDATFFDTMKGISDDTSALGARIANQIQDALSKTRERVLGLKNLVSNPRNGLTADEIRRVRSQIRGAEATQLNLMGRMKKVAKLSDTIMQRTNDPAKFYGSILEAQSDFNQLRSLGSLAQTEGSLDVTSKIDAPVVDKVAELTKTIRDTEREHTKQIQDSVANKLQEEATAKAAAQQETKSVTTKPEVTAQPQVQPTQQVQEQVAPQVQETPVQEPVAQPAPVQQTPKQSNVSELAKKLADYRAEQNRQMQRPANVQIMSALSKHVTNFVGKFKGLAGKVSTVWQAPEGHTNDLGFIDTNGNIVLIASNLEDYARSNSISLKDLTTAVIQHEGFSHYGLRTIFDNAGLTTFLTNVRNSLSSSAAWKALEASDPAFAKLSPLRQAEEFCSIIAEHAIDAGKLAAPERTAWTKVKSVVKSALTKLGFISENKLLGKQKANVTEKDIISILTKGATNLTNENVTRTADINESMGRSAAYSTADTPAARTARATEESTHTIATKIKGALDSFFNPEKRTELRNYWYDRMVDSSDPVRRLVQSIKELGTLANGQSRINTDNNVFKNLQVLNNKTVIELDRYHAKYVQPLLDAIVKLKQPGEDASIAFAKAADYLEAQHAIERNRTAGRQVTSMSDATAQKTIDQLQSPLMQEISDKMNALNKARLDMIKENRLIPEADKVIAAWQKAYKYYVPFKGWEDMVKALDPTWYGSDTRKSISTPSGQKTITKRVVGHTTERENPISHAIMQMYDIIYLAKKAEVGRSLLDLARSNADATDILEIVQTKKTNLEESFGARPRVDIRTGEVSWIENKDSAVGDKANTVAVIDEAGNMQRVLIKDEAAARALRGENILQSHPIIKAIGNVQSVMARYATALNPLFWLRNPFRDTITAALNMRSVETELRNLGIPHSKDIAKALIFKGLMGSFSKNSVRQALFHYYKTHDSSFEGFSKETREYMGDLQKFLDYGGQTEYFTQTSYNAIQRDVLTALRDKSPEGRLQQGGKIARATVEYMSHISDSLENMTRYIAFKEMVDSIKASNKEVSPGVWQRADGRTLTEHEIYSRAANVALNLTVNFGMKGSWAPVMNSLYMFSSASIAGNARMLETILRKDPTTGKIDVANASKFMMVPVLAYLAQATLCRALMPDDDDGINKYDKRPDYEKNSNFIIPGPDGSVVTIPLPLGYNFLWTFARNIVDMSIGKANNVAGPSVTKAAWSTVTSAFDTMNPLGQQSENLIDMFVPTVFKPIYQSAMNKNFAGNPIKPEGNESTRGEVPEHQKYWSTMNESVVKLCKGLYQATGMDVSPETLEHYVTSYTGGLGRIFTQTIARLDDFSRGKPADFGRVPGLNVFYKTPQDSDTSAVFSKLRTQVLTQNAAAEEARLDRTLPPEERMRIIRENSAGAKVKSQLDGIQATLNTLRQRERALDRQDSLSSDAKQAQLQQIKEAKTRAMMRFNKAAISAGFNEIQ